MNLARVTSQSSEELLYLNISFDKCIGDTNSVSYTLQFVEKPPVKKAEGFCLLVVDKV